MATGDASKWMESFAEYLEPAVKAAAGAKDQVRKYGANITLNSSITDVGWCPTTTQYINVYPF